VIKKQLTFAGARDDLFSDTNIMDADNPHHPQAPPSPAKDRFPPIADPQHGYQASCVDDPVEARAIWYVAPRSGAVMCPAYVARP